MTITWGEAIDAWVRHQLAEGKSPGTLVLRRRYLMRFAAASTTPATPADVASEHVAAFLAVHSAWAAETRYSALSTIRTFLEYWSDEGVLVPVRNLPKVKRGDPHPRPLPEHELRAVFARCRVVEDAERRRLLVQLAAGLGLRCVELSRVHTRDLMTTSRGFSLAVHGKGGKTRLVPCPPALANRIRDADGWVFPGRREGHLSPWWVSRLLGEVLPDGWTAHTLRHRFGTRAYQENHDLLEVQELLGHADPKTTRVYIQTDDDARRAIVDATTADLELDDDVA